MFQAGQDWTEQSNDISTSLADSLSGAGIQFVLKKSDRKVFFKINDSVLKLVNKRRLV